mgnify:CR=1 FL=1
MSKLKKTLRNEKRKQIILISPLKQFAQQNLDRFIEYGFEKYNTLLIDSDGCRDLDEITKFIISTKTTHFVNSK